MTGIWVWIPAQKRLGLFSRFLKLLRFCEICFRLFRFPFTFVGTPAIKVGISRMWIQSDRLVEVADRILKVVFVVVVGQSPVFVGQSVTWVRTNRLVEVA